MRRTSSTAKGAAWFTGNNAARARLEEAQTTPLKRHRCHENGCIPSATAKLRHVQKEGWRWVPPSGSLVNDCLHLTHLDQHRTSWLADVTPPSSSDQEIGAPRARMNICNHSRIPGLTWTRALPQERWARSRALVVVGKWELCLPSRDQRVGGNRARIRRAAPPRFPPTEVVLEVARQGQFVVSKMQLGWWPSFQNVGGWQEGEDRHLVEPRVEDGVVDKLLPEEDLVQSTNDCLPQVEVKARKHSVTALQRPDHCAFRVDDPSYGRNLA